MNERPEQQLQTRVLFHPLEQNGTGADEPKTEKQTRGSRATKKPPGI